MSQAFIQMVLKDGKLVPVGGSKPVNQWTDTANGFLLGIPASQGSYHKTAFECLFNLIADFTQQHDKTCVVNGRQNSGKIPMEFVHLMIAMSRVTQHMINSTSWEEGKLHKFDHVELSHRLELCKEIFDNEFRYYERKENEIANKA